LVETPFQRFIALASSKTGRRLLAEYGAVLVTTATPPPKIVFADEDEVERFQSSVEIARQKIGEFEIELQPAAMAALVDAVNEAAMTGLSITPRSADAARRSYRDTASLWQRNVNRGADHWQALGRISAETALRIREMPVTDQVDFILELEDRDEIYFGTYFDKSILYSVAAPGSSQHLAMLAFDVAEYQDEAVESLLARRGWFRTVANDLPHFTFLGRREDELPGSGLKQVKRVYGQVEYRFWVPDID
jgi:hypothetical protein